MDITKIFPFLFINECVVCGKEGEGAICNNCKKALFVRGRSETLMGNPLYFLTSYGLKGEKLVGEMKRGKVSPIPYLVEESLRVMRDEKIHIITAVPSIGFLFSFIPEHLFLLGRGIARRTGAKYIPVFEKIKRIKSQTLVSYDERMTNPLGAFKLKMGAKRLIKDKTVLIIDDVYTSGATMRECEKEITNNGGNPLSLVISKSTLF